MTNKKKLEEQFNTIINNEQDLLDVGSILSL